MNGHTYFASGTNHPGDLLGFVDAGIHVGATLGKLLVGDRTVAGALETLAAFAGLFVKVFIDSGAFSEVEFPGGVPTIVAPISDADWNEKLDTYDELAAALGDQLYCVAPDCVAHQDETLARLERYAGRVRSLRAAGANVLVAHQKGALSLTDFHARVVEILGFDDFVVAVPMAKDATSPAELNQLVADVQPARVHLLGVGPRARGSKFQAAVEAVRSACPTTEIFCDSVALSGLVGRSSGPDGGPRAHTLNVDAAYESCHEALYADCCDGSWDYTEVGHTPSVWMLASDVNNFVNALVPASDRAERRRAKADVDAWLAEDLWADDEDCDDEFLRWEHPEVATLLDAAWAKRVLAGGTWIKSTTWRKRTATRATFSAPEFDNLRADGLNF
jgi:hypothetical protein